MRFRAVIYHRLVLSVMVVLTYTACFTLLTRTSPVLAEQAPLRIMPLGNSITQGTVGSYRRLLWLALKKEGMNVDFVGSVNRTYSNATQTPDFDTDHEGHWGWLADEVLAKIDGWAASAKPDIVLLHLGTNDIGSGQDVGETVEEVAQIIERLRKRNSGVHVLLAAIIPLAYDGATEPIRRFNANLAVLAQKLNSTTSRVLLVDQFEGFDAERDTYDGVHPNETGNQKMAAKWFAGLKELLNTPSR